MASSDDAQRLISLKPIQQVIANVLNQAQSNHAVLLGQIDELLQTVLQVEVHLEFVAPRAKQEKEPRETPSYSAGSSSPVSRPSSSSLVTLTHQNYQTQAAGQFDESNGIGSRISTSSLPDLCVDSSTLVDDCIQSALTFRQVSDSSASVNTFHDQNVSQGSHDSNQPDPPHQSQEPIVTRKSCKRTVVPRNLKGRGGSMGSELKSVIPHAVSTSSSFSSAKGRLSNSSGRSRIEDLSSIATNHLMCMHGMQANGASSSSHPRGSSKVRQKRRVQTAQTLIGQQPNMPCGAASSSSSPLADVPALPHQPVEPVDAQVINESSGGTKQDEEDLDNASLVDISKHEQIEVARVSTDKSRLDISSSPTLFHQSKVDAMRSSLESQLVKNMTADPEIADEQRVPCYSLLFHFLCRAQQILLRIFGIAPWGRGSFSKAYMSLSTFVPACLCVLSVNSALKQECSTMEAISYGSHPLACLLAMLSLRLKGAHTCFGSDDSVLVQYLDIGEFALEWHWKSLKQSIVIMFGGMMMLVAKACVMLDPACQSSASDDFGDIQIFIDLMTSILITGYFVAIMCCQVHVSSALYVAVDQCGSRLVGVTDLACALSKWELLQAVLRQAACSIEGVFCGFGLIHIIVFACTALQLMQGSVSLQQESLDDRCLAFWYGWMVPPWLFMLYVFYRAADVTELCARVPSLIHSWSLCSDEQQLYDRQRLVQYMVQSEAGYYVSGVRITSQLTMKVTYLLCVVTFTAVSQSTFMRGS